MNLKKLFILALLLCPVLLNAQKHTMVIEENIHCVNDSQDARINKVDDGNGNVCALLKITLSDPSQANSFHAVPGGYMAVKKSAIEPNTGELWYWLPANIQSLTFTCADHEPYKMNVKLESGKVYRMSIIVQSKGTYVQNVEMTEGYVKFNVEPQNVMVRWGETPECSELGDVTDGCFSTLTPLAYGKTFYYRITDPDGFYESVESSYVFNGNTGDRTIFLKPSYNYLTISTNPAGAQIYVDENKVADPKRIKLKKGEHEIIAQLKDYYQASLKVILDGTASEVAKEIKLDPKFALISLKCEDQKASLYLDDSQTPLCVGSWEGRISSGKHKITSKRNDSYMAQSISITVRDNVNETFSVPAPVALYGMIDIRTSPARCDVYIDGVKQEEATPSVYKCLAGDHSLELKRDGCISKKIQVKVDYNSTKSLNETLVESAIAAAGGTASSAAAARKAAEERMRTERNEANAKKSAKKAETGRKDEEYSAKFKNKGLAHSIDFNCAWSSKTGTIAYKCSGKRPYGNLTPIQLTYTLSYKFNRWLSLGVGMGALYNAKSITIVNDEFYGNESFKEKRLDVPVFLNVKITPLRTRIRPVLTGSCGCYCLSGTFKWDVGVGCEFRMGRAPSLQIQAMISGVPWPDFSLSAPKYVSTFAPGVKIGFNF